MKRLPLWAEGVLFGILFAPLIFFLKIICPTELGCFADPFFIPIFSPIFLIQYIFEFNITTASVKTEILFIILFWGIVGGILGKIYDVVVSQHKEEEFGE